MQKSLLPSQILGMPIIHKNHLQVFQPIPFLFQVFHLQVLRRRFNLTVLFVSSDTGGAIKSGLYAHQWYIANVPYTPKSLVTANHPCSIVHLDGVSLNQNRGQMREDWASPERRGRRVVENDGNWFECVCKRTGMFENINPKKMFENTIMCLKPAERQTVWRCIIVWNGKRSVWI